MSETTGNPLNDYEVSCLDKQVVSLELAKQLKEAGYPQEGIWWWTINEYQDTKETTYDLLMDYNVEDILEDYKYVAPTVAELGERLSGERFVESHWSNRYREWICYLGREKTGEKVKQLSADTEANARAKMWLYLKKEGLL